MRSFKSFVLVGVALGVSSVVFGQSSVQQVDRQVVNGLNNFTIHLFLQLASNNVNVFMSGYSAGFAMGMVEAGAQNQTLLQIMETLGQSRLTEKQILSTYGSLMDQGNVGDRNNTLSVANGAFVQKNFVVTPKYTEQLKSTFKAIVKNVDFRNNGQSAVNEINEFVDNETKGLIPIMYSSPLSPATALVLINAVVFIGKWQVQFNASETVKAPFYYGNNRQTPVNMMHMSWKLRAGEDNTLGLYVVELFYMGDQTSMVLLVPKDRQANLTNIQRQLNIAQISRLLAATSVRAVNLSMPRFNMTGDYSLNAALKHLGIQRVFDSDAQLGGISPGGSLQVSQVQQKSMVQVDEKGTKAVAVTGVGITITAVGPRPVPLQVNANHPFLFLIRSVSNGLIYFMGRLSDPTQLH